MIRSLGVVPPERPPALSPGGMSSASFPFKVPPVQRSIGTGFRCHPNDEESGREPPRSGSANARMTGLSSALPPLGGSRGQRLPRRRRDASSPNMSERRSAAHALPMLSLGLQCAS